MSFFAKLGSSGSDTDSSSDEEEILSGSEGEEQDEKLKASSKKTNNKASMFLRSDAEDSSDEDDSDEDSDEDEDMSDESGDGRQRLANRFLRGAVSSDEDEEDEEDRTVVMSAKDKRFAEMEQAIHNIQNATKSADGAANDWVLASSELDKLNRFIARHQTAMVASPIPAAGHIPPAFLRTLVELETAVTSTISAEKGATKKMAPVKAKALSGMKQTLKKKAKEFELTLGQYAADPAEYTAAYEAANVAPSAPKAPKRPVGAPQEGQPDDGDFMTIGRGGRALNLTADGVLRTLREIVEQRGKKNTDRAETIKILSKLLEVSATTYQRIRVYLALIPARLDYSQNLSHMPFDSQVACRTELQALITLLLNEKDYVVQDTVEEYDDTVEREPEIKDGKTQRLGVRGNLIGMLENLDNEFTKTLQHTDAHEKGADYIERLREEVPIYTTIVKAQILFEREGWSDAVARAIMRRLEHIYAKPDAIVDHFEKAVNQDTNGLTSSITPLHSQRDASALVHSLAVFIYQSEEPLLRARAILAHIFSHATHGRYHQARDLLLMSHLQDTVSHADVPTQILYNRAVMQLGLAAFRRGYISECQTILSEMFSTMRQKELLAQAVQRYGSQLTPEQELVEKRRLLPFHLHLNIELLEAAYLTSCMLVEVPLLASVDTEEQKRRVSSKSFKRLLDMAEKQAFMGPPENTRDHIVKASKALQAGDWERAKELILTIKVWTLLDNAAEVKEMLGQKIQEEGLRTYLFTYSPHYASLSLDSLATTFSLSRQRVVSIISRMIYTDELQASLDSIGGVVIFHRVEQTEVQRLAQQLAEKTVSIVEQNEKTLDIKLGTMGQERGAERTGAGGDGAGGRGKGERRGGTRGSYRGGGRGRGRGFQSGLGGAMSTRRVPA
ncbi:eukaryotic translation initiation factor 3 subunit 8 N-terminus-domain-containing protein [Kockovaella imperatae]|uniref:Eukaryotic translation initiation factor 3 subunit C n=1 Tax=Kockovaella imperatae TaxID=4999 RepID=A0A1Y1UJ32_9TREE|nr:eukaryotic translation initiation factor 3 subunit 8 N-terminus-domain-containing protein [Kockovaella imperatae]ORX37992.1 eukaryotic translation initiation factor 3 subunit 8 N-terminus-domain-containing protein [Kockovaella imperatae]